MTKMQENTDHHLDRTSEEIIADCMVISALESTELALECGLRKDQIIISCKVVAAARPDRRLSRRCPRTDGSAAPPRADRSGHGDQGPGLVGIRHGHPAQRGHRRHHSRVAHPEPRGDRREEVYAACELLQSLGLRIVRTERHGVPGVRPNDEHDVPGAGGADAGLHPRTLAAVEAAVRGRRSHEPRRHGLRRQWPGESKAANIGISLPGTGEAPNCPVYIDGEHVTTLRGTYDELSVAFRKLVDDYVETHYQKKTQPTS